MMDGFKIWSFSDFINSRGWQTFPTKQKGIVELTLFLFCWIWIPFGGVLLLPMTIFMYGPMFGVFVDGLYCGNLWRKTYEKIEKNYPLLLTFGTVAVLGSTVLIYPLSV